MNTPVNTKSTSGCTYRFIDSSLSILPEQINYDIKIRQQPNRAKVSLINERDRRPIEPSPILQLHWENCSKEELKKCLQNPFYFAVANLVTEIDTDTPLLPAQNYLSGSIVSSLYRLRDVDNTDGGFFVFGDLAVKKEGKFKLRFSLFEIVDGLVQNRKTILSDTFTVFVPKYFPGPVEATFLSRTFSDQGVKMRIRKEHRLQSRKRKTDDAGSEHSSSSNQNDAQSSSSAKKTQSKKTDIVTSPSYAEQSYAFFGRWQANTVNSKSSSLSSPPYNTSQIDDETTELKGFTNKFRYQHSSAAEATHTFPSPESTMYNQSSTSNQHGQPLYPTPFTTRSMPSHNTWSPITNNNSAKHLLPQTSVCHTLSLPNDSNRYTDSPPSITLPPPNDIAKYHTCLDKKQYYDPINNNRLPTPPSLITDIHQIATGDPSWGAQLPPLRTIFNLDSEPSQKKPSSLFPLLLPSPSVTALEEKQPKANP